MKQFSVTTPLDMKIRDVILQYTSLDRTMEQLKKSLYDIEREQFSIREQILQTSERREVLLSELQRLFRQKKFYGVEEEAVIEENKKLQAELKELRAQLKKMID